MPFPDPPTPWSSADPESGGPVSHATSNQPPEWASPSEARETPPRLGRYLLGPQLGQGGMGRVFEAWDPLLKRVIALKILHRDHPESIVRFMREAELQARVHHPNICPIFEVDLTGEQPIITMQRIFGPNLAETKGPWPPEAAVRILAEAASAVHAAHLAGLVHRDLKPGNFMLEPQGEGSERVFVLDFGLARDLLGNGEPLTLERSGTPAFMSPEQILGQHERIGTATDIYGLGATLFYLLAGRPPFDAESLGQRLSHLGGWTPPSLRSLRPELSQDLDTITQKCLEPDPDQRYDSAFALEEDLRRWLAHEPIQARSAGPWERLGKWARRNPTLVRVGAASSILVLGMATITVWTYLQAHQRQALARRFGQETEGLESLLRTARLNPPHDIRPERKMVQERMALLGKQLAGLGKSARGPGLQALGMGHLALAEWDQARACLQGSWDAGERSPAVALALGTALGELYQIGLDEARQSLGSRGWEARRNALHASFLQPALRLLEPLRSEQGGAKDHLEALLAFHGGDPHAAIQKAQSCKQQNPTFHEALILEARAWIIQAQKEEDEGRFDQALAYLRNGGEALAAARDALRSDPGLWILEARRCLILALILEDRAPAREVEEAYLNVRDACKKALRLDSDQVSARIQAARACFLQGQYLRDHGQDPGLLAAEAIRWAQEATTLSPKNGAGFYWLGRTHLMIAVAEDQQSRCSQATLQKAEKALLTSESLGWPSACFLAYAYRLQAKTELRSGGNPLPSLQNGLVWARKSVETQIAKEPLYTLSLLLLNLADAKAVRGQDPAPELTESVSLSERGYNEFHDGIFLYSLAHSHYQMALHRRWAGQDPREAMEAALQSARKAVGQGPRHAILHLTLGVIESLRVRDQIDQNQTFDPGPARKAFRTALALNPTHVETHLDLARLELLIAPKDLSNSALERAHRSLEIAARLGPKVPELASLQAQYFRQRAQRQGAATQRDLSMGLAMAEKALNLNPRLAHGLAERGVLTLLKGRREASKALLAKGKEDLRNALAWDATLGRDYQAWLDLSPTPKS